MSAEYAPSTNSEDLVRPIVEALTEHDRTRLLCNLIWNLFGDLDDAGKPVLIPDRKADVPEIRMAIEGLRQDLWPLGGGDVLIYDESQDLYWNQDYGLGDPAAATRYSAGEFRPLECPLGGRWVPVSHADDWVDPNLLEEAPDESKTTD